MKAKDPISLADPFYSVLITDSFVPSPSYLSDSEDL